MAKYLAVAVYRNEKYDLTTPVRWYTDSTDRDYILNEHKRSTEDYFDFDELEAVMLFENGKDAPTMVKNWNRRSGDFDDVD